jgi:hypothetical protein
MKWKLISIIFLVAIALFSTIGLSPRATLGQTSPKPAMTFVCAADREPPTTYAHIEGKVNLESLMSWRSEYLFPGDSAVELCQQTAQKLQSTYDKKQDYLLAGDWTNERWKVCLVSQQGEGCDSRNSVYLFSLNSSYQSPRCLMEDIEPLQCPRSRGQLISLPGGRYRPSWWPWPF